MTTRLSPEQMAQAIKEGIPQDGFPVGKLRIIGFPARMLFPGHFEQHTWYDGDETSLRVTSWQTGFKDHLPTREFEFSSSFPLSKEDFEDVWVAASARKSN